MMRWGYLIFLVILCNLLPAQEKNTFTDSLLRTIATRDDTLLADALNRLAYELRYSKRDSAYRLVKYGLKTSQELSHTAGIANAYNVLGMLFKYDTLWDSAAYYYRQSLNYKRMMGDLRGVGKLYSNLSSLYIATDRYDSALNYQEKAIALKREENAEARSIGISLGQMAEIYRLIEDFDQAIAYYYEAINIFEEIGDKQLAGRYNRLIGQSYYRLKKTTEALHYLQKSREYYKEIADYESLGHVLNLIALCYVSEEKYRQALEKFAEAIQLNQNLAVHVYQNIGSIHLHNGDADSALYYYNLSHAMGKNELSKREMANLLMNRAEILINLSRPEEAEKDIFRSIKLASELGSKRILKTNYKNLSRVKERQGNSTEALKYFRQYSMLNDSLFNEESDQRIERLRAEFETEKKEQQLILLEEQTESQQLQLQQNRILLISLGLFLLLLLVIGILLFKQINLKSRQKNMLLQLQLQRLQMNPHFVFNSLASIQHFLMESRPMEASRYIGDFARLNRLILHNSREELISIEQDIETLDLYIRMQKLRFEQEFDFKIEMSPEIEPAFILIPPMLTQPFVENAIKHAFEGLDQQAELQINYCIINEELHVEVRDNGIGRKQSSKNKEAGHKSVSTGITIERLSLLSAIYKKEFSFEIKDNKKGTTVIFRIPLVDKT